MPLERLVPDCRRHPQLAARAVPRGGPGRRLGRGHERPAELILRAHREGRGRAGRLPALGALELLERLRPLPVGAARGHRARRRTRARHAHLPRLARRLRHRRQLARRRACRHGQQGHRDRGRVRARAPDAPLRRRVQLREPRPGAERRTRLPAPVRLRVRVLYRRARDRRSPGRARRLPERDAREARGLRRGEGGRRSSRPAPHRRGHGRDRCRTCRAARGLGVAVGARRGG